MGTLKRDVQLALRMLLKNLGFTFAALAALALGIGANTAIFTVVDGVLLKPLRYPDADRIVEFGYRSSTIADFLSNVPELHEYQRQTNVFQEVAAYDMSGPGFNLTGDRPEQIQGIHVTEGYFRLFGAPIVLGRTFTAQEDRPNGGRVVVLSYAMWQSRFAGDPNVIGRSLSLGNEPYTIVGVIGKQFLADPAADIWLPFQFPAVTSDMNNYFHIAGLLRPGVTTDQARAQLRVAAAEFHREFPDTNPRIEFHIEPLRDSIVGNARQSLLVMLGAVSLVLLIACSNVANLLLVRATARKREFAIRSALGATRGQIVRQLLTESVLLSIAGGVLGLALGFAGVRALLAISPTDLPRIGENGAALNIDVRVLAYTLGISFATGILFGLVPAWSASRANPNSALKESASRSGTGLRQGRMRSVLVITEVSLALILLVGSALLIRTLVALHGVGPGFRTDNILTMEMSLNGPRYQKTIGVTQLSRDGRDRLNSLPGVELAAVAYWLPIHVGDGLPFQIVGRETDKDHMYGSRWMSISPGYLQLFGIPVLRGRDFNENDSASAPTVALVNEALAKLYWPNGDAVGHQIAISKGLGPGLNETIPTIIGIVADSHNAGLDHPADPMVIMPIAQVTDAYTISYSNVQPLLWVVRTRGDPRSLLPQIAEQLRLASGGFPIAHAHTMDEVLGSSTGRQRFNMLLLTIFGAVALALAAIGVYGLMAYSVAQRNQEIGIRMALGADRQAIRWLVVWSGMRLAMAGIGVGAIAAFGLTRLMATFLFGVHPWDPAAFISAPVILAVVSLIAVWIPGLRASRIDPVKALQAE